MGWRAAEADRVGLRPWVPWAGIVRGQLRHRRRRAGSNLLGLRSWPAAVVVVELRHRGLTRRYLDSELGVVAVSTSRDDRSRRPRRCTPFEIAGVLILATIFRSFVRGCVLGLWAVRSSKPRPGRGQRGPGSPTPRDAAITGSRAGACARQVVIIDAAIVLPRSHRACTAPGHRGRLRPDPRGALRRRRLLGDEGGPRTEREQDDRNAGREHDSVSVFHARHSSDEQGRPERVSREICDERAANRRDPPFAGSK